MKQVKNFLFLLLGSTQPVYCEFLNKQKSESEIDLANVSGKPHEFLTIRGVRRQAFWG